MSLVKQIRQLEADNARLRAQGARVAGPARPRQPSLAKELRALEKENAALKAAAPKPRAQAEPTAAPKSAGPRKCLTTAEKIRRAQAPSPPDGFERIGGLMIYDPEALKKAKRARAIRELEEREGVR